MANSTHALWGFLHLKSELIREKSMQISVIIASNFHPDKLIILISLSNNIIPKNKEKYNLKKNLVLFTKNMIFLLVLFLKCSYPLYFSKLCNETNTVWKLRQLIFQFFYAILHILALSLPNMSVFYKKNFNFGSIFFIYYDD